MHRFIWVDSKIESFEVHPIDLLELLVKKRASRPLRFFRILAFIFGAISNRSFVFLLSIIFHFALFDSRLNFILFLLILLGSHNFTFFNTL